jgi:hypothetical protein
MSVALSMCAVGFSSDFYQRLAGVWEIDDRGCVT